MEDRMIRMAAVVGAWLLAGAGALVFAIRKDRPQVLLVCGGVALAAAGPLAFRLAAARAGAPQEPWLLGRLVLAVAVAALVAGSLLLPPGRGKRGARIALALVVLVELGFATTVARRAWHHPRSHASERMVFEALLDAGLYRANGVPPRIALPPWIVRQNAAPLYKWADVAGYNALTLERVWEYMHQSLGLSPPVHENTYPSVHIYDHGPFPWDSMNLVAGWKTLPRSSEPGGEGAGWQPAPGRPVFRRPEDPRAYLTSAVRRVSHWREAVDAMAAGHDFHRIALVEGDTIRDRWPIDLRHW